jgi:hypothetical protein
MNNLLLPVGIPYKARCRAEPKAWRGHAAKYHPCLVDRRVGSSVIYEENGAMPEIIASWIGTEKGVRQLQCEELAKAKGMDVLLKDYHSVGTKRAIREGVGLHLWTAALDSIGSWLRTETTTDTTDTPDPVAKPMKPAWESVNLQEADSEWTWEPPDLSVGSQFFLDRLESLDSVISLVAPPV